LKLNNVVIKAILLALALAGFSFSVCSQTDSLLYEKAKKYYNSYSLNIDSAQSQDLYTKAFEWIGVKYKYAGSSKKGIDCSGFVSEIYQSVYKIPLSGGSRDIWPGVKPVEKDSLREGDIVFFKIKKGRISHVGIYLANNKMVHASVKSGVIISSLGESYYNKYYFSGGRISGKNHTESLLH
jgi:murein DD-endopeptidase / murein LD-carboxypeptidase